MDLLINLIISKQETGVGVYGDPIFDRREVTTHVLVPNGQTIMLSGIIQKEKYDEVHKVPLLGDIPLIGGLFRSVDKGTRNSELVAFVTPDVMHVDETNVPVSGVRQKMIKPLRHASPRG